MDAITAVTQTYVYKITRVFRSAPDLDAANFHLHVTAWTCSASGESLPGHLANIPR